MDDSLGVVRIPPGSPIVVRIVLDTDGDPEALAAVIESAYRAAVEDFGAVQQGFRVQLPPVLESDCSRATGERIGIEVARAAEDEQVIAVLGPQCTASLLGLQTPVAAAGLTVVTSRPQDLTLTEGADGLIGQDRAEGTWRTSPSFLREARAAARYAVDDLEAARAAMLHDASIESTGLATAFRTTFESLGGTVVLSRVVTDVITSDDEEAADAALMELLDALVAAGIEVAFLALPADATLALTDGFAGRQRLAGVSRLSTSRAATPDFLGTEAAFGHLFVGPVLDFEGAENAVTGMSASQVRERVGALSGVAAPSGWWAYAYDAAVLLLKALEDTSLIDVDGSFVLSRAELRASLARTSFGGMTGVIGCSALGDCAAPRSVVRVQDDPSIVDLGRLTIVGTAEG